MPNHEKELLIKQIKEDIESSDAVWVVDYRGLTVKQAEDLRKKIREQGAAYKIYKNTFTIRALQELELPEMGDILEGPSGFVFINGDPVSVAKVLKQYAKGNEALSVKGGLFEGQVLDEKQAIAMADMPSREELIGQIVGMLASPVQEVLAALDGSGPIYGLLDAIEAKAA